MSIQPQNSDNYVVRFNNDQSNPALSIEKSAMKQSAKITRGELHKFFNSAQVIDTNTKKQITDFLNVFDRKVVKHIEREYSIFSGLIISFQRLTGLGTLGEIEEDREKLAKLREVRPKPPKPPESPRKPAPPASPIAAAIAPVPVPQPSPVAAAPEVVEAPIKRDLESLLKNPDHLRTVLKEEGSKWLSDLLQTKPTDDKMLEFVAAVKGKGLDPVVTRVVGRFEQLRGAQIEKAPLPAHETMRIALYIETTLQKTKDVAQVHFAKDTGLARTLQTDAKGHVYLLTQHKLSRISSKTAGSKNFSLALRVPFESVQAQAEEVARLVTRKVLPKDYREAQKEIALAVELQGPGIAELYTVQKFSKNDIDKISLMYKKYDGDLDPAGDEMAPQDIFLAELAKPEHLDDRMKLAEDSLIGLQHMHDVKKVVHGDLKPANVLLKRNGATIEAARLTDFGGSFKLGAKKFPGIYGSGTYGTPGWTPPEMHDVRNFKGDHTKADVWALGCILYQAEFFDNTPWEGALAAKYAGEESFTKAEFREKIREGHAKLAVDEGTPKQQRYRAFIASLLHEDPAKRPTAGEALEQLRKLRAE